MREAARDDVARAPPAQRWSSRHRRAFFAACVVSAPLAAWAGVAAGFGLRLEPGDFAAALLTLALWSVAEELVFRGALQPWLLQQPRFARALAQVTGANLAASLLFAALHLWRHPPLAALAVFPASLVLGLAREASGRTWPAALLHLYFNATLAAATLLLAGAH